MAKNTRARFRGGKKATTFAGTPAVVVSDNIWLAGGNQCSVLAVHDEGTSATALTLDVAISYDASTTDAQVLNGVLGATDLTFPLAEETVGTATSGIVPVTVTQRQYTFDANLLDGPLPVVTFPVSSAPCNIKLTWTETAGGAGTIAFAVISDDV